MAYIALYRKWRPETFDDVVGQESIVRVLKNQVTKKRTAHAYLFSGGRGTGKTSTAKILSRAVNCLELQDGNPCNNCEVCKGIADGSVMDVVEIDAASNNSVEDVRLIRDEVFYTPSIAKRRVYIIDEVHMLSIGAFNALLKILEEPPEHVLFILATTEPHKLPATILSRCQRFEFRQISIEDISGRLKMIAEDSGVLFEEKAINLIAKLSDGAMRDAISILDQCMEASEAEITEQKVIELIGISGQEAIIDITEALAKKDFQECLQVIDEISKNGKDVTQFISTLVRFFRDLLISSYIKEEKNLYLTFAEPKKLLEINKKFSNDQIIAIIATLSELEGKMKWASMPRVMVEVEMMKLCTDITMKTNGWLEDRIARIEAVIQKGTAVPIKVEEAQKKSVIETKKTPHPVPGEVKAVSRASKTTQADERAYMEEWNQVIEQLRVSGKMVLFSNLIGTKAKKVGPAMLSIEFGKSVSEFGKNVVLKADNQAIIKEILKRITGKDFNIKCSDETNEERTPIPVNQKDKKEEEIEKLARKFDLPFDVIE